MTSETLREAAREALADLEWAYEREGWMRIEPTIAALRAALLAAPAPSEPGLGALDTAIAILEHLEVEDDDDKDLYEDTVVGLRALAARARLRGEQR